MFPGSRKKTKVSNEVRFGKLSHWIENNDDVQNNDDVLNVGKQHYIFVKNAMLLYTQNDLRNSMNSDRFTE